MGQTLSFAVQWTSAKEGAKGKLEYTPSNEAILNSIIKLIESFTSGNPEESKLPFKQPLTWKTQLTPAAFGEGYSQNENTLESDDKTPDGKPMLSLEQQNGDYILSAWTFGKLETVLKQAGEKKMAETRACLEANTDPVVKILGERFATVPGSDSSAYRFIQEIMTTEKTEGDDPEVNEKKIMLKILMMLKDFDEKMMQDAITQISSEVKLTPEDVDRIVQTLKSFCGKEEEKDVLEDIDWVEEYKVVFGNGCRAPSWRQLHGDISYIEAKLYDEDNPLYITANTQGYFVNKGINNETGELDFDNAGDGFKRDLVALLREKSEHFQKLIQKKEFFKLHGDGTDQSIVDAVNSTEQGGGRGEEHQTNNAQALVQLDNAPGMTMEAKKKEQDKKKQQEPSLKWKKLGIDEQKAKSSKRRIYIPRRKRKDKEKKSASSDTEESFEASSSESEEEEEAPDRRSETNADLPSEYWQIQKLVKYLKGGNQTATIIALCALMDFNLIQDTCQLAIRDVGGLEVLINLLDTDQIKCKIGALRILKEISKNTQIRRAIADLGGLQTMVKILRDPNKELKCLAAETIANVARFRRARRTVRQHGGIRKLVALLDCSSISNVTTNEQKKDVDVARSGALALWSCSKSQRNKESMRKAGAIPLLARLLKSTHENMLIPVVGTLQECATESSYRLAIRTEGMIMDLVKNLKSENQELQMHCASAIFKCAEEKETRDLVRVYGGLDPLVMLLNNMDNKELLAAATGAIWKCSITSENVSRFQELKAIDLLVNLLSNQPEEVLVNVVGALAELAQDPPNRQAIRKAGGIPSLVNLLTGTNQALLINVTKAVGQCAEEPENMMVIDKLDGVRLLWSLLKNQNTEVQASAAWAICPCIENAKDAGEMVRSFVGGLELIVSLLKSEEKEVLASVCAAIANIANDEENLAVITDHGVVPMLAKLTNTTDDKLRRHLAEAIARCCNWGNNRVAFGQEGAVAPLVKYLRSTDQAVHRSTARALHQLSRDPNNCITMHEASVVKPLMEMVGSKDEILQEAAAGCIANIRRLALANEKARTK